jgi:alpha-glucosidase
VWPGYTVFPDWNSPRASEYWVNELELWRQKVPYDRR